MTDDEFRQIVSQDSALAGPLKRAAALVFMFPLAPF